jgi:transcriptional regulator with XRE-family HTH domain
MATRRDALAAHREALGFTQETLAQALGVELSTVGRWERGTLTPQPWRRPDLASILKLSLEDLDVLLNPSEKPPGADAPASFDTSIALTEFGSVPARPSRSMVRLPVGSADHLDELVSHLRDQWHALVRTDNLLGPRFALAAVRDHIAIIEELLPATSSSRRAELVTLAATYAESAAWLYEDAGQMPAATYWVGRAMEWAHEAGDGLLLAWTLFRRSQHAAAGGDAQRTISLTRAAGRDGDLLPNPMRAAIVQQEAHGYALVGEEIMSHRTLDVAHQWAALDNAGDARGGHGSFCSETYLELQRAYCWAALGKPQRAVQMYEAILPSLPPVYRRDRGVACSRLAQAYVYAGQPEAAASVGQEALAIARSSGSVRTEQEVALVGRKLTKHRQLQPVEQLLDALSATTATG